MHKKIFICFFVVLLMTTLVVPAFAASSGGPGVYSNPAVVIDAVKLLNGTNSGSVVDWPNNYYAAYGKPAFVDFGFVGFDCELTGDQSVLATTFYPGSATSFTLRCSNIFFDSDLMFSLGDNGTQTFVVTDVSVSGFLTDLTTVNDTYSLQKSYFSNKTAVNSSTVNIAHLIRTALGNLDGIGDRAWLQDVQILINYYRTDADDHPALYFEVNQIPDYNPFATWFRDASLAIDTEVVEQVVVYDDLSRVNYLDWLLQSVNSFLSFKILPNFSIASILQIVFVIGILLWVLHIFI